MKDPRDEAIEWLVFALEAFKAEAKEAVRVPGNYKLSQQRWARLMLADTALTCAGKAKSEADDFAGWADANRDFLHEQAEIGWPSRLARKWQGDPLPCPEPECTGKHPA